MLKTGASASTLQNEGSRRNPPTGVEGAAKAAGANEPGPKGDVNVVGLVKDVVREDDPVEAVKEVFASPPNIEVPAVNAEVGMTMLDDGWAT